MPTKRKKKKQRVGEEISLAELKPEDFKPVSKDRLGIGVAKLAHAPKKK